MRSFRFSSVVRKHFRPYTLVRSSEGSWDDDGVWKPGIPSRVELQGNIQPINAKLMQAEGGRYSATDRMLFTPSMHKNGDLIERLGVQYNVVEPTEREYSDINQYVLRAVVTNARVP